MDTKQNKTNNKSIGWDFKSIIAAIAVFVFVGLIFYSFYKPTGDNLERDKEYYNSTTNGVVYSINQKTSFTQGRTGNRESTIGYEIRYYYNVNGQRYDNSDFINGNSVDEVNFIGFANNHLNQDTFIVRYVSWKPEESFLVKTMDNY